MNYNRIEEALCAGELDCIVDFQMLAETVAEREKDRWYANEEKQSPYE